jgi:short-subunit dehydrogenase
MPGKKDKMKGTMKSKIAIVAGAASGIEGYSESLDHELRTRGIRVSVIEPAYTKTQFDRTCTSTRS